MPLRLDYADPLAAKKVKVASLPDGGEVIDVPPSRAPAFPFVGRVVALLATLVYAAAGISLLDGPREMLPLAIVLCMGFPVGLAFLVWSSVRPPAKRQAGLRLSALWRSGTLTLRGPDIPYGPEEVNGREITDVRVDFHGGIDRTVPHMRMTLCRRGGTPLLLLAEQDPGDLLVVADTLRRLLGLPSRTQRMAAWFGRMAAGSGQAPAAPIPVLADATARSPVVPLPADMTTDGMATDQTAAAPGAPAVPVLSYATRARASRTSLYRGDDFNPGGMVLWFNYGAAHAAFISATVSRIQVVWQEGVVEFPCAGVYGLYVGAASQLAPLTLYVCALDGIHGVLTGLPPEMLRNAARRLNDMLGVEGSVDTKEALSRN